MRLDNSMARLFRFCPAAFFERYVVKNADGSVGIEPILKSSGLTFGTRMHELLQGHYGAPPQHIAPVDDALEAEAQATLAAYMAHYPVEDFEVVDTEHPFEVPLENSSHTLLGKIDMLVRIAGKLWVFETKTEKRNGRDNTAEAWANKPQVALYKYAAETLYGEPVEGILLNVVTRASDKGQIGPTFPPRQSLVRTPAQIAEALRGIVETADDIERAMASGYWRQHGDNCAGWKGTCDYYPLHIWGRTAETLSRFKPAEDYLGLGGKI